MVVMNRYVLIFGCLYLNVCHAMLEDKYTETSQSSLRRIEQKNLTNFIGRAVLLELPNSFKQVTLGNRVLNTEYYQVYTTEDKHTGEICLAEKLYYMIKNSDK